VLPDITIGPPIVRTAAEPHSASEAPQAVARPDRGLDSGWSSAPPLAASAADDEVDVSIAATFERLLKASDLELDLESLDSSSGSTQAKRVDPRDLDEVRALFAQLAANHVRQVRDFMFDLRLNEASVDWILICEPALQSLRRAAEKLDLGELCTALDGFCGALAAARAAAGAMVEGRERDALLESYEELSALMPQAFALDLDGAQRDAVILQSLLLQVPEVKKVTIDRLYAAGLTTLQALFLATPGDVASTTGIGQSMAERIVEHVRAYRQQVRASIPDAARMPERERIAELAARLRCEHEQYERVSDSWTREASEEKRKLRTARARTLLDIQLVLARLGEVERLKEIERLPFEGKLAQLASFLEEAPGKYECRG
jgi:hypothetical protein